MANSFIRYHLPAILWAAVVLFLTLLPAKALPYIPSWKLLSFDTFCHVSFFAALSFLVIRSFYRHYGSPAHLKFAVYMSLALCLFFGILIELLQTVMKMGRHGDFMDVASDFTGQLIGAAAFYFLLRKKLAF